MTGSIKIEEHAHLYFAPFYHSAMKFFACSVRISSIGERYETKSLKVIQSQGKIVGICIKYHRKYEQSRISTL